MGQYADLFARIVHEEQDMPELMAGEAEALDQVKKLAADMNGAQYNVEIGHTGILSHIYFHVTDDKGKDLAIIPFKLVPGTPNLELALIVGWGDGEARFNLATEEGYKRAVETVAQETLGQIHNDRRAAAIMRHLNHH